ncbi:MAG: HAD family hydrolase [Planctomycetota bacterium]|jgi:phosphoglycolate phosphatase
MAIAAVMFDLDGTLLDTLEDLADSMNAVLERLGLPCHPVEAYKHFVGDGMPNLVRRALPDDRRDGAAIELGSQAMREEYSERWRAKTRPYDGVPGMLDGLIERGLKVTILSNKPDDFTKMTVEALLPDWRFHVVRGVLPDVPRKPDPTAALRIANELGIAPMRFLYCGDTDTDMKTAVAAGMVPLGALWGFRDEAELRAAGASVLLERPEDLLEQIR